MKDSNTSKSKERASYARIRDELSDKLFVQIVEKLGVEKRYLDPDYSAKKLAIDLHTNPRYISCGRRAAHRG